MCHFQPQVTVQVSYSPNVDSGFLLVTSQDPNFETRLSKSVNAFWDLQHTMNQPQVHFKIYRFNSIELFVNMVNTARETYPLLQFILDSRSANKDKVPLNQLRGLVKHLVTVRAHCSLGLGERLIPLLILGLLQPPVRESQRPQSSVAIFG